MNQNTFQMRTLLINPAFVLIFLFSCRSDDNEVVDKFDGKKYPQKWTLVQMTGNVPNVEPLTGDGMSWQEYYIFNIDKTFLKVRDQKGIKSQADGTYDSVKYNNIGFLDLTFNSGQELIASCTPQSGEQLHIVSDSEISSTWMQCDGPGLNYKRLE